MSLIIISLQFVSCLLIFLLYKLSQKKSKKEILKAIEQISIQQTQLNTLQGIIQNNYLNQQNRQTYLHDILQEQISYHIKLTEQLVKELDTLKKQTKGISY